MEQKKHEGAGFLLRHADAYVLFERVKKEEDLKRTPHRKWNTREAR